MWRDGLRALLTAQNDLDVVGEPNDEGPILPRALKHRPDLVLCDSAMGESAISDMQELRDLGIAVRVIVFGSPAQTVPLPKLLLREIAAVVPKNSPTELLLNSIRKADRGERTVEAPVPVPVVPSKTPSKPGPLSRRERQLVGLIALGFRNREIADKLFISEQTVKNHLHNVFEKTGIKDRLELALYAIYHGLYE